MSKKRRKKAGGSKGDDADKRKIPDDAQTRGAAGVARYGKDALASLLWNLIDARTCLILRPRAVAGESLMEALIGEVGKRGRDHAPGTDWLPFYEAVSKAVLEGDGKFFREVGRLLEKRVKGSVDRRTDLEVAQAFATLRARAERENSPLPTKKQVREAAQFSMALTNILQRTSPSLAGVLQRKDGPGSAHALSYYPRENVAPPFSAKMIKQVKAEVDLLPEQNWTAIFKRCGLAHLPNDKGGQPAQRRNR